MFAGLHAVFALLLARCSGERDIAVVTPTTGAPGNWTLHTDIARAPTFRSLLAQSRDIVRDAQTRSSIRFAGAEALSQPGRAEHHTLLFQLDLVQREDRQTGDGADIVGDFALCASRTADGLSLEWAYAGDLLDASAIARMARRLEVLVDSATTDPDADPWRLTLLDAAERQRVLYGFNDTQAPFRQRMLQRAFRRAGRAYPGCDRSGLSRCAAQFQRTRPAGEPACSLSCARRASAHRVWLRSAWNVPRTWSSACWRFTRPAAPTCRWIPNTPVSGSISWSPTAVRRGCSRSRGRSRI